MNHPLFGFFLVGLGGGVGACVRYGLTLLLKEQSGTIPWGTVAANIVGSFVIGIIAGLDVRIPGISPQAKLLLATGFCGGLTTLSSFIFETAKIGSSGEYALSACYVAATLAGSSLMFALGLYLAKSATIG